MRLPKQNDDRLLSLGFLYCQECQVYILNDGILDLTLWYKPELGEQPYVLEDYSVTSIKELGYFRTLDEVIATVLELI